MELSSHNLAGIYFAHPCADPLVLVEPVNQEVVEQDEDVEEGYAELGQRGGCHCGLLFHVNTGLAGYCDTV